PAEPVSELVEALVGVPAGAGLRIAAEQAAGNPLYVRELVDALGREGAIRVRDGHADLAADQPGTRTPTSLSAALADRLGFLTSATRAVLRLASLLGTEFSVTE